MDQPVNETPTKEVSRIIITFAEANSTLLDVRYENTSPLQVLVAGWVLKKSAEDAIEELKRQQQAVQQLEKIAVPRGYGGMTPK